MVSHGGPMPRFQLLTAISLFVSAVISVLARHLTRIKDGKIRLPTDEQFEHVVFDNDTDGYPIDEESFWTRVC